VTETRTKANRRPIVAAGAFCDIDQRRLARIDSIVIIAGMHRRGPVDASIKPYPPNAGDGGARAATSFVANSKRSEDAEDEPPTLFARRREGRVERYARRTKGPAVDRSPRSQLQRGATAFGSEFDIHACKARGEADSDRKQTPAQISHRTLPCRTITYGQSTRWQQRWRIMRGPRTIADHSSAIFAPWSTASECGIGKRMRRGSARRALPRPFQPVLDDLWPGHATSLTP
jgi:hypothetical protein